MLNQNISQLIKTFNTKSLVVLYKSIIFVYHLKTTINY